MAFLNMLFPRTIAEGASGGRQWQTDVVRNRGGHVKTNANWPTPLGRWEVGQRHRTEAQTQQLLGFFHLTQGRAHSFRFHDPLDCLVRGISARRVSPSAFQIRQRYAYGDAVVYLDVTLPVPGDPSVLVGLSNGAQLPVGSYHVNPLTGVLTTTSPIPDELTVQVRGFYHIPVMFDTDHFDVERITVGLYSWPSIPLMEVRVP